MNANFLIIAGFGAAILLVTAAVTLLLIRFRKTSGSAFWIGGLSVPVLLSAWGLYDLMFNLEVDTAPPGMIIIGGLVGLAIVVPFTLLTSFLVVRFLRRRELGSAE